MMDEYLLQQGPPGYKRSRMSEPPLPSLTPNGNFIDARSNMVPFGFLAGQERDADMNMAAMSMGGGSLGLNPVQEFGQLSAPGPDWRHAIAPDSRNRFVYKISCDAVVQPARPRALRHVRQHIPRGTRGYGRLHENTRDQLDEHAASESRQRCRRHHGSRVSRSPRAHHLQQQYHHHHQQQQNHYHNNNNINNHFHLQLQHPPPPPLPPPPQTPSSKQQQQQRPTTTSSTTNVARAFPGGGGHNNGGNVSGGGGGGGGGGNSDPLFSGNSVDHGGLGSGSLLHSMIQSAPAVGAYVNPSQPRLLGPGEAVPGVLSENSSIVNAPQQMPISRMQSKEWHKSVTFNVTRTNHRSNFTEACRTFAARTRPSESSIRAARRRTRTTWRAARACTAPRRHRLRRHPVSCLSLPACLTARTAERRRYSRLITINNY
ncbi:unnamed protein product [Trichogramma brassicae]|uniref:Uncharacterized protein n=1 Tax=Trichogramma brassicae TaxID=86971 RepID=A0A6H5J0V7_9HYME|nr:unnamed protein product [Trichogramma brassicae]